MSEDLSKKLQRLDDFLTSEAVDEDAMMLGELDGFLAGVIVCPNMIPPSEWLPEIWGAEPPTFDSEGQAKEIVGLIMGRYNEVIRQLDRSGYSPVYHMDRDDTALWQFWVDGFWRAMCLRPDAWAGLARAEGEEVQMALFELERLIELSKRPDDFEPMEFDKSMEEVATDLISLDVEILHRARLGRTGPGAALATALRAKVGRNDPCPCGSGKKYKKCCLG